MSERWVMVQPAVGAARLAGVADSPIPVRADRVDRLLGSSTGVVDLPGVCDEIARFADEQPDRAEQLTPSMVRLSQLAVDDAIEREDWFEAVRLARRGRAWDPTDLASVVALGHALHGRGLHDDAAAAWSEAVELARGQQLWSPMLWLLAARSLQELDRPAEAVMLLDEVLDAGDHPGVRRLRDRLASIVAAGAPERTTFAVAHPSSVPDAAPVASAPDAERAEHRRRPAMVGLLVGVVVVAAAVVGLAVLSNGGDDASSDADGAAVGVDGDAVAVPGTETSSPMAAPSSTAEPPAEQDDTAEATTVAPTTVPATTIAPTSAPPTTVPPPAVSTVTAARLVDSRAGQVTVDGAQSGIGRRAADEVTVVSVAGRGGIPLDAQAAVLNIAALVPDGGGFITAYPCDVERPNAAALLFGAGLSASGSVTTALAADGTACLYTSSAVDLIVDTTAFVGADSAFRALVPARLVDSRAGQPTVDGVQSGIGRRAADEITTLQVIGRGGVPAGAQAAVLNIAALSPGGGGFVTAYPCDAPRPTAAAVLYDAGASASGSVTTPLAADGTVCLYTSAPIDLVVDTTAFVGAESEFRALVPARLADTRTGQPTVDGAGSGSGRLAPDQVAVVTVAGRGGVPADATTIEFVVAALGPDTGGFITAYPCDAARPTAVSLVYDAVQSASSTATSGLAADGTMCVYTTQAVDVIVDVTAAG